LCVVLDGFHEVLAHGGLLGGSAGLCRAACVMPAADEVSRDNPGALPHKRSAAQSERTWIGLGLAAWNGGIGVEW